MKMSKEEFVEIVKNCSNVYQEGYMGGSEAFLLRRKMIGDDSLTKEYDKHLGNAIHASRTSGYHCYLLACGILKKLDFKLFEDKSIYNWFPEYGMGEWFRRKSCDDRWFKIVDMKPCDTNWLYKIKEEKKESDGVWYTSDDFIRRYED